ncbi:MAG: signal peptidase II [Spirochaetaceae bacterium]
MTEKIKRNIILSLVIIINLAADQITKILARIFIQGQGMINVIGDFFILVYAENDGAFLSMFSDLGQPWKTIVLVFFPTVAIVVAILYLIFGKNVSFNQSVAIACIIGGGIGNVYDRIVHLGAVTDFLLFGIGPLRTGVLNVADLSITFGAITLFVFQYKEDKKAAELRKELDDRTVRENS